MDFNIILIILAIIGGISSLFKDKKTEQPKKKTHQQPRPTTPVPDSSQKQKNDQSSYEPSKEAIEMQEQRDSQMQQLAERMNIGKQEKEKEHEANLDKQASIEENNASIDKELNKRKKQKEFPQTDMQKRVRNNLNRKGLVDGIIMSEVLGPPRARKPYQSVITKRSK